MTMQSHAMVEAVAPEFVLDRCEAVPALIGRHDDFLIIAGLAGTSRDVAALTGDGAHIYTLAGAMGGACTMGLGLALARPDRRVLVVTGDGELIMNLGSLATIAVLNPPNLSIVCVDNGHYGETGYIAQEAEIPAGARLIREGNGTAFVLLRVKPTEPPAYKRNLDPAACRVRFRTNLL
jgi:phosphonopyruvate decarboxylase